MIEAYVVGTRMVLDAGAYRAELSSLIQQWESLEKIIQNVQKMGGLAGPVASAAAQMSKAATDMAAAMPNVTRQAEATAAAMERAASACRAVVPYQGGGALVPYVSPSTGFTLNGGGYTPYGYTPAGRPISLPVPGTSLVPYVPRTGFILLPGGTSWSAGTPPPTPPGWGTYGMPMPQGGPLGPPNGPGAPPPIPMAWPYNPRPTSGDFAMAAVGYGIVGRALTGFAGDVIGAGMDVGKIMARMRMQGYTDEQVAEALRVAQQTQREVPGATVGGALTAQLDLNTILRNPSAAETMAPDLMRLAIVLSSAGKGDQLQSLFQAMQAGELKGMIHSPEEFGQFLHMIEAASITTGGRIGPAELLKFLQNSGVAGGVAGQQDLFGYLIPTMLSMGANRAGTALQGMYRQFGAGKMSDAAFTLLNDMGLITDPKKAKKIAIGYHQLLPGGLKGEELVKSGNLAEFMRDVLLPAIKTYNLKMYGRDDINLEATTGMTLASTITGSKELSDYFRLLPLAEQYRTAIGQSSMRDAFAIREATDPSLKVQGLSAAWNGFLVSLSQGPVMDTAIKVLQDTTGALNWLGKVADDHKTLASMLVETAGGLGALAVGVSAVSGALFVAGPMIRAGKWMAGAAATGAVDLAAGGGAAMGAKAAAGGALGRLGPLGLILGAIYEAMPSGTFSLDPLLHPIDTWNREQDELAKRYHVGPYADHGDAVPPGSGAAVPVQIAPGQPLHVIVDNGRDLAHGVASGIADQGQLPRSDTTGVGTRVTIPQPGWYPQ